MRNFVYPIGAEALEGFALILSLSSEDLKKAHSALSSLNLRTGAPSELTKALQAAINEAAAHELSEFLRGIRSTMDQYGFSISEMSAAIGKGLQAEAERLVPAWEKRREYLEDLLSLNCVHLVTKVSSLHRLQDKSVHGISVVSSITPIFNQERSEISGNLIKSSLVLNVSDRNEIDQFLEFPLGEQDLRMLSKQAEQALQKIEVLRRELGQKMLISYSAHP